MDHQFIKFITLNVFHDCKVYSFPINCFEILNYYGLSIHPYSSLDASLREYCFKYSEDALNYRDKICYNDNQPSGRIRFSLMHELGHILLNHTENHTPDMEQEANYFASNILAPRMAIHYAACKNHIEVSRLFELTNEAAQYTFDDYRRWYRRIVFRKMDSFDKALYLHFYNDTQDKFIYHIKPCVYCETLIYNSTEYICNRCSKTTHNHLTRAEYEPELLLAESQWLYEGL